MATESDPDQGIVSINNFTFCFTHGSEVCNKCCYDLRIVNNFKMEKQLRKAFPKLTEDAFESRPPLCNALLLALDSGKKDPENSIVYQCKLHTTTDCKICFDWARLAIDLLKKATSGVNTIAIESTREEKIAFLKAMGVELLLTTRLPVEAIDKKLRGAIDAAQHFALLVNEIPINPASFPNWSQDTEIPLLKAVRRGSPEEAREVMMARTMGRTPFPLYESAFMDVRQTLMTLGNSVDEGCMEVILQDKDHNFAICLRVLEVRKVTAGVPMFILTYGRGTHNSPLSPSMGWIQDLLHRNSHKPTPLRMITATPEEQNLLLTIFQLNSKRLPANYSPDLRETEKTFMVSFLLPIGPLDQTDIGRLANHTGCIVCGNKTVSRCSGCLSIEYCGQECQKVHWKEHKPMCNTLKGGTWVSFTATLYTTEMRTISALKGGVPIVGNLMNNRGDVFRGVTRPADMKITPDAPNDIAPNVHGDTPFIVKIQCPADARMRAVGGSMLIYDRQRSFQAYLESGVAGDAYREAMSQPEMAVKGKIYRWAKRLEGNRLSVCFDKPLAKDPAW